VHTKEEKPTIHSATTPLLLLLLLL